MRRTAIFIDHENLSICARNRGIDIDYYELKNYLASEKEGRLPLESFCYVALDPRNEHGKDLEIQRMQDDGWFVKCKTGAMIPGSGGRFKCNVDVEMAMDVVSFSYEARPDLIVLVTGDQDFAAVVRKLRERGIRVEVAAFPENISHILLNSASSYINLEVAFQEITGDDCTADVSECEDDDCEPLSGKADDYEEGEFVKESDASSPDYHFEGASKQQVPRSMDYF